MKFLPICSCRVPLHTAPASVIGTFFIRDRLALPLLLTTTFMAHSGTASAPLKLQAAMTSPERILTVEDSTASMLSAFIQQLADSLQAEFGVACHDLETDQQFYFNAKWSIWIEYNPIITGYQGPIEFSATEKSYNSVTYGFDVETGGHFFKIFLTNSSRINLSQFLVGADDSASSGDWRIGFAIIRVL